MQDTINFLQNYIPKMELRTLVSGVRKNGKDSFIAEKLKDIEKAIKAMPPIYTNEHLGKDAPIKLHYFGGATDIWLSELDRENREGFGLTCLNGDTECAELGYVSIAEIISTPFLELDLYWNDKTTFKDVLREMGRD